MRVLHLVANLQKGGAEKQLYLLVRESSAAVRHEVVAVQDEGHWAHELRRAGANVSCWFEGSLKHPSLVPRLAAELRARRPGIVHAWLPSMNLLAGVAAHLAGPDRPRVVASIRNVDDWKPLWRIWLDRLASHTWDAVIVNSRAGLECARRQGLPAAKLSWIPNGIPRRPARTPAERNAARRSLGIEPGQPLLAAASRLVPQKKVDRMLEIAADLRASFPSLQLLIGGDGPERASLESQARRRNLGAVRFLGALPDTRILFAAADAFLSTSDREGTSNSVLEAMQAGCPVFATAAGDTGVLLGAPPCGYAGPAEGIAPAVARALSSPGELDELSARAAARAAEFDVGRMALETVRLYDEVLATNTLQRVEESGRA